MIGVANLVMGRHQIMKPEKEAVQLLTSDVISVKLSVTLAQDVKTNLEFPEAPTTLQLMISMILLRMVKLVL